jgi:putative oxidoreductase
MTSNLGPAMHAILRIAAGLLFMQHGLQKLFGMLGGMAGAGETAPLMSQLGLAGVFEFGGGLLLLAGFATRPIAFVLLGEMIAAYAIAHLPRGGWPVQNQGELALLYAAIFAFFVGNGAGPFSVDETVGARTRRTIPA